jgi:hypothetical protein
MQVKFGPSGSQVDLGGTLGNIIVTPKYGKAEIKADQFGNTVLDRRVSGFECMITTELAEVANKDIWKVVFPHATETGTGTTGSMSFISNVGDSDLANSQVLTLHPLSNASGDTSHDYTFYKAVASAESTIEYSPTGQSKLKIVWNILPDTSVTPPRFFKLG